MNRSAFGVLAGVLAVGLTNGPVYGLDLTGQAGYGALYTNNTAEVPEHATGEWIQTPELILTADHQAPSAQFSAGYDVTREIHQRDVFGDDTIVAGQALLIWQAVPNRLQIDASNVRTRTTIDSRGQSVQNNLQMIDTSTAGATLTIDSFSDHYVDLGYHYTFYNADKTDTDSRDQIVDLSYVIPLSRVKQVQLNGFVGDVKYDSSTAANYKSRGGNLEYIATGEKIDLDIGVGYTVFDQDDLDDVNGTTGNVDITWRFGTVSSMVATYSRALESGAATAANGIPTFGQDFVGGSDLTQPYTLDQATLGVTTIIGPNTITLSSYAQDQKYQDVSDQDQGTVGATLGLSRRVRPTITAQVFGDYATTDYDGDDRTDHDASAGLQLQWTRWRNLSISGSTVYTKKTSDVETAEYTEWVGSLNLLYTFYGTPSAERAGSSGGGIWNSRGIGGAGHSGMGTTNR